MNEGEDEPKTNYGLDGEKSGEGSVLQEVTQSTSWAGKLATDKIAEVKQMAREGDLSIRLLAQLGGLAMMFLSILGFIMKIINMQFLGALVEVYTFLMGLVVIILESKAFPRRFEQSLNKYCLFLRFVWGRGCLYFVAGSLQATQGKLADLIVGCFMILIGVVYIYIGRRTANKLSDLKKSLISEEELRRRFQECDLEQNGTITKCQFKNLTNHMGLDLNRRELEAAWMYLDKQDAGEITYEEFQTWWVSWDLDDSSPGNNFEFV